MKTFKDFFKGYSNYDNGGPLDKRIISDANKVYSTLKTPEAIKEFYKKDYKTQMKTVKGISSGHSGFSFYCVCLNAYNYATYIQSL